MREIRYIEILDRIESSSEGISAVDISILLNISSRTVRNDVKQMNEEMFGFASITSSRSGLVLTVMDSNKYEHYKYDLQKNSKDNYLASYRVDAILLKLLFSKDYTQLSGFENEYYVSAPTLSQDIKKLNVIIEHYCLKINTKPGKGIIIVGFEKNIRRCITERYLLQNQLECFKKLGINIDKIIKLNEKICQFIETNKYDVNGMILNQFIAEIDTAIIRSEYGYHVEINQVTHDELFIKAEYNVAIKLVELINSHYGDDVLKDEVLWIEVLLISYQKSSIINAKNENIAKKIITESLTRINDKYGIDYTNDEYLHNSLYFHLLPLLNRIHYDIQISNPLAKEIKLSSPFEYDLAIEVSEVIKEMLTVVLSENEVSYLCLHFKLSNQKSKSKSKNRVAIVMPTNSVYSELIEYKIRKRLENEIATIDIVDNNYSPPKYTDYDLIIQIEGFTDNRKYQNYITISSLVTDEDIIRIRNNLGKKDTKIRLSSCISKELFFTDINETTAKDVIKEMCKRISKVKKIDEEYYKLVIDREEMLSTELGNMVAYPHPITPYGKEPFMAIGILKKPIIWGERYVQIVCLLCVGKKLENMESFYSSFVDFVSQEKNILQLIKNPNFDVFKEMIK